MSRFWGGCWLRRFTGPKRWAIPFDIAEAGVAIKLRLINLQFMPDVRVVGRAQTNRYLDLLIA